MHRIKQEYLYSAFLILIIICIFQYGIQKICGFTMYPDEFGYWASAAKAVGYDWTEVASLGSYYSFGYSLLLTPLLILFRGGVKVYRAAVALNMILMCFSVLLLWNSIKKLFPETDAVLRALVSGAAVFYPAWIFYMQMTLAEALITFLFVSVFALFISFIQKPGLINGMALAWLLVYTYCVHMRTIGVAIACFLTLTLWGLTNPALRKYVTVMLGIMVIAGLAVIVIKKSVILSVFSMADQERLEINGFSSQIWKIREILSAEGVIIFLKEIIAKIFYMGIAGFGIFYWILGWCVRKALGLRHRRSTGNTKACALQQWAALFLLLTIAGEVLICSIYMHGSAQIDCLIYGRYNEFLMPIVIAVGIPVMLNDKKILKKIPALVTATGIMVFLILSVIEAEEMEGIRGYFVVGLSCLIKEESFEPLTFFRNAWILGAVLMTLTAGIIWLIRKKKEMVWLMGILIAVEIIMGIHASAHYTYKVNRIGFENLRIAEKILEEASKETKVVYLNEGTPEFIDFQQMQMPELPIHVIEGDVEAQKGDLGNFLIADCNTAQGEVLGRFYDRYIKTSTFVLYYNSEGVRKNGKDQNIDSIDVNNLYFGLN